MKMTALAHLAAMAVAAVLAAPILPASAASTTVKPYGQADVDYGRKLQAKLDKARADSTAESLSKSAIEPYRIVGDVYFVGVHNFGAYIVKTRDGLILLDSGWKDTAEKVQASIEKLGFKLSDIKIMLTTEGHPDHNGAAAYFKAKTGAQLMVMEGDEGLLEEGRIFPAAKVDKILHDRDQVTLGGKVLTAYHIPGHTKGSTTWYWQEAQDGVTYNVADVCCWFTPDNVVSDPNFPTARLEENWTVLKSLPVDIPLPGIHTYHFDMFGKLDRLRAGERMPWVDPQGYRGIIAAFEQDFKDKLAQQRRDGPPPPRAPRPPPAAG